MCDHCGCRSFPAIAELTVEHFQVLALAEPLAEATRHDRPIDPAVPARLREILVVHAAKEEAGLYPLLIGEADEPAGAFDHLEDEHRELLEAIDAGTFDHLAFYGLQRHIEEEEEVLFSGAFFYFDGATWDELDAAHRRVDPTTRFVTPEAAAAVRASVPSGGIA